MADYHWKRLAVHRWLSDVKISESVRMPDDSERSYRRFTATIHGWRNCRLVEGFACRDLSQAAIKKAREIRDEIERGEYIFDDSNTWDYIFSFDALVNKLDGTPFQIEDCE